MALHTSRLAFENRLASKSRLRQNAGGVNADISRLFVLQSFNFLFFMRVFYYDLLQYYYFQELMKYFYERNV